MEPFSLFFVKILNIFNHSKTKSDAPKLLFQSDAKYQGLFSVSLGYFLAGITPLLVAAVEGYVMT